MSSTQSDVLNLDSDNIIVDYLDAEEEFDAELYNILLEWHLEVHYTLLKGKPKIISIMLALIFFLCYRS